MLGSLLVLLVEPLGAPSIELSRRVTSVLQAPTLVAATIANTLVFKSNENTLPMINARTTQYPNSRTNP